MPIELFVQEAISYLSKLLANQHAFLGEFKRRLLLTIAGQFEDQPKFKLFYVRTLLELHLH